MRLNSFAGDALGAFERVRRVDSHRRAGRDDVGDEHLVFGRILRIAFPVPANERFDRAPEPLDDLPGPAHDVRHVHGEHRALQERAAGPLASLALGALFVVGGGILGALGILARLGRLPQLPDDVALPPRRSRPPDAVLKPRPCSLRGPAARAARLARDCAGQLARGVRAHFALSLELLDGLVAERIRQAGQRGAKIVP